MKKAFLKELKRLLTLIGAKLPKSTLHLLQMIVNYMKLGNYMAQNGFQTDTLMKNRTEVFDVVAEQVSEEKVLYLEFGVFQGKSMKYWSKKLKNPESMLHGFDSFEGLPEDFDMDGPYSKGTFDTQGKVPVIDDKRVKFHKGWFEDILPTFSLPEHDILIINLDADLYTSTAYVLTYLMPSIKAGTYIYFDDLSRLEHEPKAFSEFIEKSGKKFQLFSCEKTLNRAFFLCLGRG